ncbi:MAG: hypothetical protein ACD_17C00143G0001 [uncultured bacterium]|nr:MAG: hypothetical protein ACD_17C00143G0001 [uncultured bacterium]
MLKVDRRKVILKGKTHQVSRNEHPSIVIYHIEKACGHMGLKPKIILLKGPGLDFDRFFQLLRGKGYALLHIPLIRLIPFLRKRSNIRHLA